MKQIALSNPNDYHSYLLEHDINYDSFISLRNQLIVRKLKTESKLMESKMKRIITRINRGDSLHFISKELSFSSYKLAKLFLEYYFQKSFPIQLFLENPSMISNEILREDLLNCISKDSVCSLEHSLLSECCGREYEDILIDKLHNLCLCFETEQELRNKGRSKTPDVLFLIPMAITTPYYESGQENEFVLVNWIDSKALFADVETLEEHLTQFRAYSNRYGHGLVIYWFGFEEGVIEAVKKHDIGVTLTSSFPEKWIFPTGEEANGQPPSFSRNHVSS